MFLIDTSVWIEVFRKYSKLNIESVVHFDEMVTCLPVIQEVLQGFDDQQAFDTAREAMYSFPVIESPLRSEVFEDAIDLFRLARRRGYTIRSGTDCLIAACAIRSRLTVLHCDRDFDSLELVSPLKARNLAKSARRPG